MKLVLVEILSLIKAGYSPAQISEKHKIPKTTLQYSLNKLKKARCIEKIGYGVWEYIRPLKEVPKSVVIGRNSSESLKPNTVRGHGFLFKLDLPKKFRNWNKREKILKDLKIKVDPYYVGGVKRGQRLTAQKTKVALTDRSILVNFPESYIAETSTLARKDAVAKFLRVIKHLERILRANFSQGGKYKFRVSRQHYALIKNSLARQYLNDEYSTRKLNIYAGRGLWLLIDNSYNLEELETVHKKTAVKDNLKVQNFFNGLDMVEGYTPQFVMKAITKNAQHLEFHAENMRSHVEVVKKLGHAVEKLTVAVKELKK